MPVPKATVNKNNQFVSFQDKVRFPRQVLHVEPEPVSQSVDCPSDQHFGNGSLGPYPAHDTTSFLLTEYIGHFWIWDCEAIIWEFRVRVSKTQVFLGGLFGLRFGQ